jgi:hypothetical protein
MRILYFDKRLLLLRVIVNEFCRKIASLPYGSITYFNTAFYDYENCLDGAIIYLLTA